MYLCVVSLGFRNKKNFKLNEIFAFLYWLFWCCWLNRELLKFFTLFIKVENKRSWITKAQNNFKIIFFSFHCRFFFVKSFWTCMHFWKDLRHIFEWLSNLPKMFSFEGTKRYILWFFFLQVFVFATQHFWGFLVWILIF